MMDAIATTKSGRRRSRRNIISILVTTSHPTTDNATTTSHHSNTNVGGALTLFCPRSGTIQSSTRIHGGDHTNNNNMMSSSSSSNYTTKGPVGVSHISLFPQNHHYMMGSDASSSSSSSSSSLYAMAYGASIEKSTDSYGMFISIRRNYNMTTVPPYVHWKCRLPEANMSGGLVVSPVTLQHVIGGGHSGTLYVWNTFANGNLIRIFPSVHYRAITCMIWATTSPSDNTENPWNSILVTAGADGMVHCFSHLDLVDATSSSTSTATSTSSKIQPIRSWTKHHLPVTSLISIQQGSRIVSSGEDGLIVIMELCSGSAIATIQLPHAIRTLQVNHTNAECNLRLFAGSIVGRIYIIDLDTYACHSTIQMGATMIQTPLQKYPTTLSVEDQVFGTEHTTTTTNSTNNTTNSTYQSELHGHDHAITSLVVFHTDDDASTMSTSISNSSSNNECLISGDEMGIVRMWDTRRGCCLRVLYPWSSTASSSSVTKSSNLHPVTSIHVIYDASDPYGNEYMNTTTTAAMFGGANIDPTKRKRVWNFADWIAPLQKFASDHNNDGDDSNGTTTIISVPYLQSRNTISSLEDFWDLTRGQEMIRQAVQSYQWKRPRRNINDEKMTCTETAMVQDDGKVQESDLKGNKAVADTTCTSTDSIVNVASSVIGEEDRASLQSEVERLKQELNMAQQTIVRWELVNNKLMERLNAHGSSSTS